ncbi:MAG TPA: reverse transcriptase family protein [Polyangiaceae bacterium]|nr:reverse transcriptase family protein [Polyangiaceae bacterium]
MGWFACFPVILILALAMVALWLRHRVRVVTNDRPGHWLRARFGRGFGVGELARRLGVSAEELRAFEPEYRSATIPKRGGPYRSPGARTLRVPSRETKALQRRILERLLRKLRVHAAATGFERGRSIVDNALPHAQKCVVIKLDLVDFFQSTSAARVHSYFRRIGWSAEAATLLTRLCTDGGGLPQGAPTSPALANRVNFGFDVCLERMAKFRKGVYTRYADDITFSFPKDYPKRMRGIVQVVCRVARRHGYRVHKRTKLAIRRRHQQQLVTGLVVNDGVRLPRKMRRWLRAVEHRLATNGTCTLQETQLEGWRAYARMVARQAQRTCLWKVTQEPDDGPAR